MTSGTVVVDSSPLIILFKCGLEHILPKLFEKIVVPFEVRLEIEAGPPTDRARERMAVSEWITFAPPRPFNNLSGLGAGEGAVIATPLSIVDAKVMIDDAAGRRWARSAGLTVVGTGGSLVLASRARLIDSFEEALMAVMNAGLWLGPVTVELLRKKADS